MNSDPATAPRATQPARAGRLPPWLRVRLPAQNARRVRVRNTLAQFNLHTVCEGARCPNQCECWQRGTATFMILGAECTRDCRFCAVPHGTPAAPRRDEPAQIAAAAVDLGLTYVVITSVTRDDLPDGGAAHFAATVTELRTRLPHAGVEVLTPDFGGSTAAIATVLAAGPTVFNHNLETCARLTPAIRSGADYGRSLAVLRTAAGLARKDLPIGIKSGFMLGLGESDDEVHDMLRDLRRHGVEAVTIGQYLAPSPDHWPVARFVPPEAFAAWGRIAHDTYGFTQVASAPLVRSSYRAERWREDSGGPAARPADPGTSAASRGRPRSPEPSGPRGDTR